MGGDIETPTMSPKVVTRVVRSNSEVDIDIPPKSPLGDAPLDPMFLELWEAYPKGSGSKQKSYQQWRKIKHRHEEIMAGLAQWKNSERWAKGYVKACEIWLRDGMWENPPEPYAHQPAEIDISKLPYNDSRRIKAEGRLVV